MFTTTQQPTTAIDNSYITERLTDLTGESTSVASSRFINSPIDGHDRYHAVAHIGKNIVSGAGKTINELISNLFENYTA
jgi:hypothetical protein